MFIVCLVLNWPRLLEADKKLKRLTLFYFDSLVFNAMFIEIKFIKSEITLFHHAHNSH